MTFQVSCFNFLIYLQNLVGIIYQKVITPAKTGIQKRFPVSSAEQALVISLLLKQKTKIRSTFSLRTLDESAL